MFYTQFLQGVHERLRPETYLEVGVRDGRSLTLSRARSVGVDPAFAIEVELDGDLALVRTTSDEYFARPDPLALTGGWPFHLAFLDGLHLFEVVLRDFLHAERLSTPWSVIVVDDVLPRREVEVRRSPVSRAWTGMSTSWRESSVNTVPASRRCLWTRGRPACSSSSGLTP